MVLGVANEVITWQQAKKNIQAHTVESLGKLGRTEADLATYKAHMAKVKDEYNSVSDFIKITVLERACRLNADCKKEAVEPAHSTQQLIWRLNDFPYNFEPDVQHWLLWSSNQPLEAVQIQEEIRAKFPDHEFLWFVNPAALQSVTSVWHCHVLVRPTQRQPSSTAPPADS
eukprot:GHRR01007193.1.p1 GENE.GHRR01007193.1~~GHRR01007193.1.p1  ORF type:complete len:171 (+),score=39.38 GHRR01007193.1:585-1097(+)